MARRTHEAAAAVGSASQTQRAFGAKLRLGEVDAEAMPKHYEDLLTTRLLLATSQTRYLQGLFGYNVALAKLKLATGAQPLTPLQCGVGDESADVLDRSSGGALRAEPGQ